MKKEAMYRIWFAPSFGKQYDRIEKPSSLSKAEAESRRSKLLLAAALVFAVAALVALAIAIFCYSHGSTAGTVGNARKENSADQRSIAYSRIRKAMNPLADPCVDFNEFACGRFLAVPMTDIADVWLFREASSSGVGASLLEEEEDEDKDWPSMIKAKQFYKACKDEDRLNALGLEPLKGLLEDHGSWPVLRGDAWNNQDSSYLWKDRAEAVKGAMFNKPMLGLPARHLLAREDDERDRYHARMLATAAALGADADIARADMREVLEFEMKLANASMAPSNDTDATLMLASWKASIMSVPSVPTFEGITGPEWLFERTPPRVIANYFGWRLADTFMKYTNGSEWRYCVFETGFNSLEEVNLRIPVAAMHARRHLPPKTRAVAVGMVERVRSAFMRVLDSSDWLDPDTKLGAMKKLGKMETYTAYPDDFLDKEKVERLHEGLVIRPDDYLGNVVRLQKWSRRTRQEDLKKVGREMPMTVHRYGYYERDRNLMRISGGYLQGDYFHLEAPMYLNFASFGTAVGQGMAHGFNRDGRLHDYLGRKKSWWSRGTNEQFVNRTRCLVRQYSDYRSAQVGLHLDGTLTLDGNMADNVGVKLALMAYEQWVVDHGEEEEAPIPGLDLTPRQLFWINYAQQMCIQLSDAHLKLIIQTEIYPPPEFRVNGPLTNMPQFARDFSCPSGAPMNPVEKCTVW